MPNQQDGFVPANKSTPKPSSLSPHERERRESILRDIERHVQQEGPHIARQNPNRARQFMPFAALKGYHELARERERIVEPKQTMTDDHAANLSRIIASLTKGATISVKHYEGDHYTNTGGLITAIDETFRVVHVFNKRIAFDDIASIEILVD